MSISSDLRALLIDTPTIYALTEDRIHVDHVPQDPGRTIECEGNKVRPSYIWLGQSGVTFEECLADGQGALPDIYSYDVELYCPDKATQVALSTAVESLMNYRGQMGSTYVQAIYFDGQSDDYIWKGAESDSGHYSRAYTCDIYPQSIGV